MGRKGLNLYDLGRLEEAISYFDKVLGADSDNSAVLYYIFTVIFSQTTTKSEPTGIKGLQD